MARTATPRAAPRVDRDPDRTLHPSNGRGRPNESRPTEPPPATGVLGRTTTGARVTDPRIEAAIRLVQARLETGVGLDQVAADVGLSRSRLEHLFRAQTGSTLRRWVRAARLARAKVLLRDPRLRVKEVASRCGYAGTSSLTREFGRQFGLSPSRYRRGTSG